jgi:hypothetical protein
VSLSLNIQLIINTNKTTETLLAQTVTSLNTLSSTLGFYTLLMKYEYPFSSIQGADFTVLTNTIKLKKYRGGVQVLY